MQVMALNIYERMLNMLHWEINGNLDNEDYGLRNYPMFSDVICKIKNEFDNVFTSEIMNRIPFYVDNAISNSKAELNSYSGQTPISTPVLEKIIVIKLNICPDATEAQITFQFAHELTHVVFWDYFGFKKPSATVEEESICTAVSLIMIKNLYPSFFEIYKRYVDELDDIGYRNGLKVAQEVSYDINKIRSRIETCY